MGLGVERVQAKIKADVARILQTELKDPRMGFVTVISCELTSDYRHCKVFVSILANREGEERRVMRMLEEAAGYIQRLVARGLRTRVTPQLEFVQDKGVEHSVKIGSLLDEIRREREEREGVQAPPSPEDEDEDEDGSGAEAAEGEA